ncbi:MULTISPECIES: chalcone isomerase family protein [Pseudomonadati]|uniref:Chalcone isomerase family protein n=1 Tax=Shewanella aestuarii TaxID=1028752 RepID=A0ABT0KZM2_9GAMM|nr:chalcone isomerase family protein [Shewanella aestuarii]MCL1116913.1 chalcone isomerase family protein [Shewanella aestuarii]GGN78409.1 hypothetical protein GCM10009193_21490 [Shewanella aestuarii]
MQIHTRWLLAHTLLLTLSVVPLLASANNDAANTEQPNPEQFNQQQSERLQAPVNPQPIDLSKTNSMPSKLIKVGEADMNVLWFDVYLAKLYSVDGIYQPRRFPLMLDIEYHRDISAQELIDATIEQWQENGISAAEINTIKSHLMSAWPDVKQNDRLSFIIHNEQQAEFLFNDKPFYQLADQRFSDAFIGIWLSEKTTHPKLRQQLIGAK